MKWIVLLMATTVLAGCDEGQPVVSLHPLYDERTLTFEPMLVGSWKQEEDTWTFKKSEGGLYRLLVEDKSSDDKTIEFEAAVVQLAGFLFLDLCSTKSGETGAPAHAFFRLRIADDSLSIAELDEKWIEKELVESQLAHIRAHGKIVITAPTIDLQYFFRKHALDAGAFHEDSPDGGEVHLTRN